MDDAGRQIYLRLIDTTQLTEGLGFALLAIVVVILAREHRSITSRISAVLLVAIALSLFVRFGITSWAPYDCSFPPPSRCRMSEPWSTVSLMLHGFKGLALLMAGIAALVGVVGRSSPVKAAK
ncbi:MAG: hypothetical protein H7A20_09460 [Rhodanobacteraceae bacterium]|nr:hypothetical protein [Rhodanobacteraceae bacterium]HPF72809.1 hypothetical protein [Xanthomonadaceae bacterium]